MIIQEYQHTKNPNILILLTKLDGTLNEFISNRNSRFGCMPIIKRKKDTEAKFHKLSETINDQQTKINQLTAEITSINEKEAEINNIKNMIKTNRIESIELKHQENISKIENSQNKEITTI